LGNLDVKTLTMNNTPGLQPDKTIDFSDAGWYSGGISSVCAKRNWANKYNLVWDGITNYNGC
jgi:hypothetical protein